MNKPLTMNPNAEDIHKLHLEVTQIVNQRLLVTTFAVTVFGAIVAWSFQKTDALSGKAQPFVASAVLNLVLGALLWLHSRLMLTARTLTTYLEVTGASGWEKDWAAYRNPENKFKYEGYTKPQMLIFAVLGLLGVFFPWGLEVLYSDKQISLWGLLAPTLPKQSSLVVGLVYLMLWWYCNSKTNYEKETRKNWQELNAKLNQPSATDSERPARG